MKKPIPPYVLYRCKCGYTRRENVFGGALSCDHCLDITCKLDDERQPGFEIVRCSLFRHGRPVFPKVDNLGSGKDRIKGAWMPQIDHGELSIYISCGRCGTINDGSDFEVPEYTGSALFGLDKHGVLECFHCGRCNCDHFVVLGDYVPYRELPRKFINRHILFAGGRIVRI